VGGQTRFNFGKTGQKGARAMTRKLYKSRTNRKLAGVCGGIGEYLNVDPTVIRILWVVSAMLGGIGLLTYIIVALIMPEAPY
jgi:phage shock protein C